MDTRTFPVAPAQLDALAAYLKGFGMAFDPAQPTGEAKTGGWDISWVISPGSLAVTVLKHPFAEEGMMWDGLARVLGYAPRMSWLRAWQRPS